MIHPIGSSHRVLAPPLLDPSHRFIHDQCGWLQVSDVITLPMKLTPSRCRCAAFSSVRVYDHLQSSSVICSGEPTYRTLPSCSWFTIPTRVLASSSFMGSAAPALRKRDVSKSRISHCYTMDEGACFVNA